MSMAKESSTRFICPRGLFEQLVITLWLKTGRNLLSLSRIRDRGIKKVIMSTLSMMMRRMHLRLPCIFRAKRKYVYLGELRRDTLTRLNPWFNSSARMLSLGKFGLRFRGRFIYFIHQNLSFQHLNCLEVSIILIRKDRKVS